MFRVRPPCRNFSAASLPARLQRVESIRVHSPLCRRRFFLGARVVIRPGFFRQASLQLRHEHNASSEAVDGVWHEVLRRKDVWCARPSQPLLCGGCQRCRHVQTPTMQTLPRCLTACSCLPPLHHNAALLRNLMRWLCA